MKVDRYCRRGNEFEPDIIGRLSIDPTYLDYNSRKVLHLNTTTVINL